MNSATPGLMTVKMIAERLAISVETVRRLVRKGDLAHHRVGCQIRISEQQLQAYLYRDRDVTPDNGGRVKESRFAPEAAVNWDAFQTKARCRRAETARVD